MRQQAPDLFIANLRLPGHGVWLLLEQMAGEDNLSVIPVLAMTTHQIITVRPRDRWDLLNVLRDFRWDPED
jgi:CheY-like chemotaxis protein